MTTRKEVLSVRHLEVKYASKQVVFDASLTVSTEEIVGLIGHNGAGKTSTLKGIFGLINTIGGTVYFNGRDIKYLSIRDRVREGMAFVQQDRAIFGNLSVIENLELGGYLEEGKDFKTRVEKVFSYFPILRARQTQTSGKLSGGEQKQLAIGMALIMEPAILLLDEPSVGLSPILVQHVTTVLDGVQKAGKAILLVEQNIKMVFSLAETIYVMKMGSLIHGGRRSSFSGIDELWNLF